MALEGMLNLPAEPRKRLLFLAAWVAVAASVAAWALGTLKGEYAAIIICLQ